MSKIAKINLRTLSTIGFLILSVASVSMARSPSEHNYFDSPDNSFQQTKPEQQQQQQQQYSSNQRASSDQQPQPSMSAPATPPATNTLHNLLGSLLPTLLQASQHGQQQQAGGRSIFSTVASLLPMLLSPRDEASGGLGGGLSPVAVGDLLRMVGIDSSKIGTMVINAIVYVIEMVSSHFFGGSNSVDSRNLNSPGAFFMYLFDSKRAEKFMKMISNPDYPINIINNLRKATGNDTVCIQQLICKMSPFWWGVNRSVRDLLPIAMGKKGTAMPNMGLRSLLTKYVPSIKDFTDNSDICDARYPGCIVIALMNTTRHYNDMHP